MVSIERTLAGPVMLLCLSIARTATGQETVIYNFGATGSDGQQPHAGLVMDAKGNFYGTTSYGGPAGAGTVFEISPSAGGGWMEKVIYAFKGTAEGNDGRLPLSSLIQDSKGNLYGSTYLGGSSANAGTVFQLSQSSDGSWTETILHRFGSYAGDGDGPQASLAFDVQRNIYGTTTFGGISDSGPMGQDGYGTAFKLVPSAGGTWSEEILYDFGANGLDGIFPRAGLTVDTAGNLYGTTSMAGTESYTFPGTVFELTRQSDGSWQEKILHEFQLYGDGSNPIANLILDSKGNLYGTSVFGGDDNAGTVFELSPASDGPWTEKVFGFSYDTASFGFSLSGSQPAAGVTMDSTGNLYGTTENGGPNIRPANSAGGTVFELTPQADGTWTETLLHSFPGSATDGFYPVGGVIIGSSGKFYGTTQEGGLYGKGTVFEISLGMITRTATTLVVVPSTSLVAGEPITLTATVTQVSGTTTPTGTVTFTDPYLGAVTLPLNQTGTAVYTGVVPPPGTYTVFAHYNGTQEFLESTSPAITRTVTAPIMH